MTNRSKYNAKKVSYDGYSFDSISEYRFYLYLKEKEKMGIIKNIVVHPKYQIIPNFIYDGIKRKGVWYEADFQYENIGLSKIVIDVKGMVTPLAILKRKLFEYTYPNTTLVWLSESKKYGGTSGFIETDKLKKIRKDNKKNEQHKP